MGKKVLFLASFLYSVKVPHMLALSFFLDDACQVTQTFFFQLSFFTSLSLSSPCRFLFLCLYLTELHQFQTFDFVVLTL